MVDETFVTVDSGVESAGPRRLDLAFGCFFANCPTFIATSHTAGSMGCDDEGVPGAHVSPYAMLSVEEATAIVLKHCPPLTVRGSLR